MRNCVGEGVTGIELEGVLSVQGDNLREGELIALAKDVGFTEFPLFNPLVLKRNGVRLSICAVTEWRTNSATVRAVDYESE